MHSHWEPGRFISNKRAENEAMEAQSDVQKLCGGFRAGEKENCASEAANMVQ